MNRTCKHKFRPGCEDLEGRQLLSSASAVLPGTATQFNAGVHIIIPARVVVALQAVFVVQDGGVPGFQYDAAVVFVSPGSPLLNVALNGGSTTTSLNVGDDILTLDGLAVNFDGSNLSQAGGLTPITFIQAGSTVVQNGDIIIPNP